MADFDIQHYYDKINEIISIRWQIPLAFVRTFGCQQNVSDSERLSGMLAKMGFGFTDTPDNANLILFNTCAVREHAQDRVFGNVGRLKAIKEQRPDTLIVLCGCMMQQQHVAEKIRESYPYVGLVFGTNMMAQFPKLVYKALKAGRRVFEFSSVDEDFIEGLPVRRDRTIKAWLPIMYGCNNFCSYCIVPHVRGRERSRDAQNIIEEAKQLIAAGYREITLLGQNVNSYGNDKENSINFPALLKAINDLPGEFIIRFTTSHPKDATKELFDTMAQCEKVNRHLHLPFQSGNNEILRKMNRKYTREQYLQLVQYAREKMPDLSITSDVIVGFPGETYEQFCDTLDLVRQVEFTSLFTFIFSPRKGTPAALMEDKVPHSEKVKWFTELTSLQEKITSDRNAKMVGKTFKVLCDEADGEKVWGRTSGNQIVEFKGTPDMVGKFLNVKITEAGNYVLKGQLQE